MAAQAEIFEKPYVLLCEGVGDERFYKHLFEKRAIGSEFHIRRPYKEGAYNGGITNFGSDLRSISVSESFIANVKAVLVVADNDSDMRTSFATVQSELRKVSGFGVPDAERVVAESSGGRPKVVVLMLPIGKVGNLESMCLEAIHSKFGLEDELNVFVDCTPARAWSVGKQAKMRMQTMLAATNKKQPDAGFAGHWSTPPQYRVPLNHTCFDQLAEFLANFPSLVA